MTLVLVERPEKRVDLIKRPPVAATRRTCHVCIQNSLRKGQFSPIHRFPLCLLPVFLAATLNFLPLFNSVTFISHFFSPSLSGCLKLCFLYSSNCLWLKNQPILMTFNITVVLAFVGKGGRWHFGPAMKMAGWQKSLKTTDLEKSRLLL